MTTSLKIIWAFVSPVTGYTQIEGSVRLEDGTGELLIIYANGTLHVLINGQVHLYILITTTDSNFMKVQEILDLTKCKLNWSGWMTKGNQIVPAHSKSSYPEYMKELMKMPMDERRRLMNGEFNDNRNDQSQE
jgi:hypothetical protein